MSRALPWNSSNQKSRTIQYQCGCEPPPSKALTPLRCRRCRILFFAVSLSAHARSLAVGLWSRGGPSCSRSLLSVTQRSCWVMRCIFIRSKRVMLREHCGHTRDFSAGAFRPVLPLLRCVEAFCPVMPLPPRCIETNCCTSRCRKKG